jgi:hypothetical protein
MKSYSTEPARRSLTLVAAALAAAALPFGGVGCQRIQTEQTNAQFIRSSSDPPCTDDGTNSSWTGRSASPRMMDTYIVQLLEFDNVELLHRDGTDCTRCVATGENCHVEEQECYCGGPAPPSPTELDAMLSGAHIGQLDFDHLYCLQVLAVDRSSVTPAPPEACSCDPSWTTQAYLSSAARLCALSAPYSAGPLDVSLNVRCRGDYGAFAACIGVGM